MLQRGSEAVHWKGRNTLDLSTSTTRCRGQHLQDGKEACGKPEPSSYIFSIKVLALVLMSFALDNSLRLRPASVGAQATEC
jgi:hypothetical protein